MELKDQKAIVTGGADGIGKAICLRLAEEGADIGIVDINFQGAQGVAEEIKRKGVRALPLKADVGSPDEVRNAVEAVLKEWGQIDILVNNAGIAPRRDGRKVNLIDMSDEEWERVLRVNLTGMFHLCKACLPSMIARRYGKIVNISSVAGRASGSSSIHYATSKAGIFGFTRTLALEAAPYGINANVVMPSRVETKLGMSDVSKEILKERLSQIPLGRFGKPQEIAEAVLFLVNHRTSSWITGAILNVSGGLLMD